MITDLLYVKCEAFATFFSSANCMYPTNSLAANLIPNNCPISVISSVATPINHINGANAYPKMASIEKLL